MKIIIIHRLRLECRSFITTLQGWLTYSIILELEDLLADQEVLAKQFARISIKSKKEALFSNKKIEKSQKKINMRIKIRKRKKMNLNLKELVKVIIGSEI